MVLNLKEPEMSLNAMLKANNVIHLIIIGKINRHISFKKKKKKKSISFVVDIGFELNLLF